MQFPFFGPKFLFLFLNFGAECSQGITLKQPAKFQANFTMDECKTMDECNKFSFQGIFYSKTASKVPRQSSRQISQWMNVTMDECNNFSFQGIFFTLKQPAKFQATFTMDECNYG